jgi:hypothetical protein
MSITYINPRSQAIRERLRDAMRHLTQEDLMSPEVGIFTEMSRLLNSIECMTLGQLADALKFFDKRDVAGLKTYLNQLVAAQDKRRGGVPISLLEKQEEVTERILAALDQALDITGLGRHGIDEPTGLLMEQRAIEKFEQDPTTKGLLTNIEDAIKRTIGWEENAKTKAPYKLEYDLQVFEDEKRRPFGVLVAEFTWENAERLSLPYETLVRVSTVQHIDLPLEQDILAYDKKLAAERKNKTADVSKSKESPAFPPELLERMRRERSQT